MATNKKVPSKLDTSNTKQEFATSHFNDYNHLDDRYFINGKNPDRQYRWIRFGEFQKNGFHDVRGWYPLTKANLQGEKMPDPEAFGVKGDGFYHSGDLICAWMPIEVYELKRKRMKELDDSRLGNINSNAKATARKGGIPLQAKIDVSSSGRQQTY